MRGIEPPLSPAVSPPMLLSYIIAASLEMRLPSLDVRKCTIINVNSVIATTCRAACVCVHGPS